MDANNFTSVAIDSQPNPLLVSLVGDKRPSFITLNCQAGIVNLTDRFEN